MSIKKKIIFSFFISAFIIAVLAVFEYVNYHQVRDEMRFLEVTDTIRSKSLQLRRHEKNYLLYAGEAEEELKAIYDYIGQLEFITSEFDTQMNGTRLNALVRKYRERFVRILELKTKVDEEFDALSRSRKEKMPYAPLITSNFLDRPGYVAYFLVKTLSYPTGSPLITDLKELDGEISALRKNGEDILSLSKQLDTTARQRAERGIRISQFAILAVFPLFLAFGLGALFYISNDVVRRLRTLTDAVEKTGERYMPSITEPEQPWPHKDEVGELLEKFLRMDKQLELWAEELQDQGRELLESKKLAAIGTLASGVAHELNNPLNNIFISVQVLQRQIDASASPELRETLDDIASQTVRVRGIVADLLEFAREKEPHLEYVELEGLVRNAHDLVRRSSNMGGINFIIYLPPHPVIFEADRGMFERVFVNLFTNALAAMEGSGNLVVKAEDGDDELRIWVSDTGKGMSEEVREKVFDPFFTRKEKGTGLGLAIVMNIIKKHHGTISVVSEEDEGTAFEIVLPKQKKEA